MMLSINKNDSVNRTEYLRNRPQRLKNALGLAACVLCAGTPLRSSPCWALLDGSNNPTDATALVSQAMPRGMMPGQRYPMPRPIPGRPPAPQTPPAAPKQEEVKAPEAQEPEKQAPAQGPVTFRLENADLLQFINLIASQLKMNYVVDPAVKGTVNITTAGELTKDDLFPILQTVLKINGATAIQSGNFFRILPLSQAAKSPLPVYNDSTGKTLPSDDRMMMQIIPLRFVPASDMAKMLTPFLSDGGIVVVHEAGNILVLVDTSLNMKRLMDIIAQFDNLKFARERVHLVPVHNNVASGLVPELESVFSAYALSEKNVPIRFIPLNRINAILVVTPDPSAFEEVDRWVQKFDQPAPASGIQTFIYRVQNSEASYLAKLLGNMLGLRTTAGIGLEGATGEGAGEAGAAGGGGAGGGRIPTRPMMSGGAGADPDPPETDVAAASTTTSQARIIPDLVSNSLIIESTAQQYAEIVKALKDLDVIPRQVYIEARVYEVDLTADLSFGVNYFLQQRDNSQRKPLASFSSTAGLAASAGTLVGQTRELLAFLNASENRSRVRVLSAPTVLATDNSDAKIQVGSSVPTLTSQAVGGTALTTGSLQLNTVQNVDTGIILTVTPRITSTGLVSLKVAQEVSNAVPPAGGGIQSPSFLKRSIQTHVLVQDGDTIALGGLISYNINTSRNRVPLLGDIPLLGALFGSTTYSRTETELIVVLTPRIVKDVQAARDATQELREKLKDLRHSFKE